MCALISRFFAHFRRLYDKCISFFNKNKKRPKKTTKVIELVASGYLPATSAYCIKSDKDYRIIR